MFWVGPNFDLVVLLSWVELVSPWVVPSEITAGQLDSPVVDQSVRVNHLLRDWASVESLRVKLIIILCYLLLELLVFVLEVLMNVFSFVCLSTCHHDWVDHDLASERTCQVIWDLQVDPECFLLTSSLDDRCSLVLEVLNRPLIDLFRDVLIFLVYFLEYVKLT